MEAISEVEVTSEEATYPIESALIPNHGVGWRAAEGGKQTIRLHFDLDTPADEPQLEALLRLTERYCVVYQTLRGGVDVRVSHTVGTGE